MIEGVLIGAGIATMIYLIVLPSVKEEEYMAGYAHGYEDCRRVKEL